MLDHLSTQKNPECDITMDLDVCDAFGSLAKRVWKILCSCGPIFILIKSSTIRMLTDSY